MCGMYSMPREARDDRSGDVQDVRTENCSCVFGTPAIPGGRQITAPCVICTPAIPGGRQITAPCVICTPAIPGGRIPGVQM